MDPEQAIEVSGLRKRFGPVEVLKGLDLRVPRGAVLALLGRNGAGKTTTVRILSTLLVHDDGSALVNGFDVATQANSVRGSIGLTGQQTAVDGYLTGRENLVLMGRLFRLGARAARRRAAELLELFDLVDAADRQVRTYSGGMRRRLDLSISLLAAPPVLFLDEPTTGLDPRSRNAVWDMARRLVREGTTILLTTQYLVEADELADRVAVVEEGRIVAEGTPAELKRQVGAERLAVTLRDAAAFKVARDVLADERPRTDERSLTLDLAVEYAKDVRRVLDRLGQAGVEADDLALHKPTLDDVFLALTDRKAG